VDDTPDPRVEFARRLQALREATGLSIRQLEIESERTPRRRNEEVIRLKRSTIAGMTNRERPVRPELANFEVFVDTCLRIAAEKDIPLPDDLADRQDWDKAYRDLRDQLDRFQRRVVTRPTVEPARDEAARGEATPVQPPPARPEEPAPRLTRRTLLLAAPAALVVAGTVVATPLLLHRSKPSTPEPTPGVPLDDDGGYSPVGKLLSPALAVDDPVWSVAVGVLKGEPVAVVGRGDGTLQLWNPATGRPRSSPLAAHEKPIYSIALSSPLAVSASVDGTLRVWDLTADPPTSTRLGDQLGGGINSVALGLVNGRTVAVSASDDRTVRLWDPTAPTVPGRALGDTLDSEVNSIAVGTLNGATIAVSGSTDGSVRLWDVAAGRLVRRLGAHEAAVGAMAVGTVRGMTVAVSGGEDGQVRSWDLTAAEPTARVLSRASTAFKTVAIGAINGRTVAISGNDDDTIRIWDLATGLPYGRGLTGPAKGAEALAISSLGPRSTVVSGHWDGTLWTWSL
jgi:hypothetical protein